MRTMTALVAGLALAIAVSGCSRPTGAAAAADAMGAADLNSIQFSGSGTNYAFGQAYAPGGAWPRFDVKTYAVAIDYQAPAMKPAENDAATRPTSSAFAPMYFSASGVLTARMPEAACSSITARIRDATFR